MRKIHYVIIAMLVALAGTVQGQENHNAVTMRNLNLFSDIYKQLDLFYVDCAVEVGEYRGLLRASCLEDFFDSGKTLSDIAAGDTAGVERSHGKLCTGFTDGLSRDDTDGFAYTDRHFGCKVRAVAVYAAAVLCAAIDD